MKLLIDTHIFLWFVNDDLKLDNHLKDIIEDTNNSIYLSIASLWEMSIKYNLGKLYLDQSYEEFIKQEIDETRLILLNINLNHLIVNANLPFHHKVLTSLVLQGQMAKCKGVRNVNKYFAQL